MMELFIMCKVDFIKVNSSLEELTKFLGFSPNMLKYGNSLVGVNLQELGLGFASADKFLVKDQNGAIKVMNQKEFEINYLSKSETSLEELSMYENLRHKVSKLLDEHEEDILKDTLLFSAKSYLTKLENQLNVVTGITDSLKLAKRIMQDIAEDLYIYLDKLEEKYK